MNQIKKNVFLKGLISYSFSNVVIYFLSLLSVPIFISYFGLTQYGLWVVLLSLISYLSNSQFGLGTVTSVLIAKTEDAGTQNTVLTRSIDILFIISVILLALSSIFYFRPELIISIIGEVPPQYVTETAQSLAILYFSYLARLPFVAFTSAFVGHQDVQLERLYIAVLPPILSFLALVYVRQMQGSFFSMAAIVGVGQIIISLMCAVHYFLRYQYYYFGSRAKLLSEPSKSQILRNGGLFFIAGLSSMIITNTDNLILSHLYGPQEVAPYSITYKVFTIAFSIFFILNSALWPMFGRAFAKNEMAWIRAVYQESSVAFPIVGGLIWVGGLAFMSDFIYLWIGNKEAYAGLNIVFALGGYGYLASVVNFQTGLLSSVNHAKPFMWIGMSEAAANLGLSLILCQFIGPAGVAYGTFLGVLITSFVLTPIAIRKYVQSDLIFPWQAFLKHMTFVLFPTLLGIYFTIFLSLPLLGILAIKILIVLMYCLGSYYFIPQQARQLLKNRIERVFSLNARRSQ